MVGADDQHVAEIPAAESRVLQLHPDRQPNDDRRAGAQQPEDGHPLGGEESDVEDEAQIQQQEAADGGGLEDVPGLAGGARETARAVQTESREGHLPDDQQDQEQNEVPEIHADPEEFGQTAPVDVVSQDPRGARERRGHRDEIGHLDDGVQEPSTGIHHADQPRVAPYGQCCDASMTKTTLGRFQ